jgi:hypothetical protein
MNQAEPSKERCKFVVKGMSNFVDFLGPIKHYGKMHMMEVVEISQKQNFIAINTSVQVQEYLCASARDNFLMLLLAHNSVLVSRLFTNIKMHDPR